MTHHIRVKTKLALDPMNVTIELEAYALLLWLGFRLNRIACSPGSELRRFKGHSGFHPATSPKHESNDRTRATRLVHNLARQKLHDQKAASLFLVKHLASLLL